MKEKEKREEVGIVERGRTRDWGSEEQPGDATSVLACASTRWSHLGLRPFSSRGLLLPKDCAELVLPFTWALGGTGLRGTRAGELILPIASHSTLESRPCTLQELQGIWS